MKDQDLITIGEGTVVCATMQVHCEPKLAAEEKKSKFHWYDEEVGTMVDSQEESDDKSNVLSLTRDQGRGDCWGMKRGCHAKVPANKEI